MSGLNVAIRYLVFGLALAFFLCASALAEDWQAVRLRGDVFVFSNSNWEQLARGDTVTNDQIIRTTSDGRVQFRRGNETIDLGPDFRPTSMLRVTH